MARAHEQRGHPVWRYRFDWQAPVRGACHALDLPFTFGTLDVDGWRDFAGAHDPRADALSQRMRSAWTSFARAGRPADDVAGPWPEHDVVHLGGRRLERARRRRGPPRGHLAGRRSELVSGLDGRVAIVTGASRGIGKGCALELGAAGATVYVTGRSVSESDHPLPGTVGATAHEIDALGGTGIAVACRPSRRRRRRRALRSCRRRARQARHPREQRVHRDERAHVGATVLGAAAVELGRHDRRRHTLGVRRERVRGAADGPRRPRPHREHQRVGRGGVRVARRVRRGQVRARPHHRRHRARARVARGVGRVALAGLRAHRTDRRRGRERRRPRHARRRLRRVSALHRTGGRRARDRFRRFALVGPGVPVRDLADEYGFRDVDGRLPPGPMQHATPDH